MKTTTTEGYDKVIHLCDLELAIIEITNQLTDKDCQRVEFLRGVLSVYIAMANDNKGWTLVKQNQYFQ